MRRAALLGVLLVAGGCAPAPARAPSADFDAYESAEHPGWLQVDSGPGRFSVLLPSMASRRQFRPWYQTRAYSLGRLFIVAYREDPKLSQGKVRLRAFEQIAATYTAEAAETLALEPMSAFGSPGRKLVFRDRQNRWVSVRLLAVDTRLYELTVMGAPGEPLPESDAAIFFTSFEPETP